MFSLKVLQQSLNQIVNEIVNEIEYLILHNKSIENIM